MIYQWSINFLFAILVALIVLTVYLYYTYQSHYGRKSRHWLGIIKTFHLGAVLFQNEVNHKLCIHYFSHVLHFEFTQARYLIFYMRHINLVVTFVYSFRDGIRTWFEDFFYYFKTYIIGLKVGKEVDFTVIY